eukprot:4627237-Pleurochrysis_carterae.AAC.1
MVQLFDGGPDEVELGGLSCTLRILPYCPKYSLRRKISSLAIRGDRPVTKMAFRCCAARTSRPSARNGAFTAGRAAVPLAEQAGPPLEAGVLDTAPPPVLQTALFAAAPPLFEETAQAGM